MRLEQQERLKNTKLGLCVIIGAQIYCSIKEIVHSTTCIFRKLSSFCVLVPRNFHRCVYSRFIELILNVNSEAVVYTVNFSVKCVFESFKLV